MITFIFRMRKKKEKIELEKTLKQKRNLILSKSLPNLPPSGTFYFNIYFDIYFMRCLFKFEMWHKRKLICWGWEKEKRDFMILWFFWYDIVTKNKIPLFSQLQMINHHKDSSNQWFVDLNWLKFDWIDNWKLLLIVNWLFSMKFDFLIYLMIW